MSDWIKHDGGPQPVRDWTWVRRLKRTGSIGIVAAGPYDRGWKDVLEYQVLNQHLIDAARLEGIRLGLEAAASLVEAPGSFISGRTLRALNPETIAKAGLTKPAPSDLPSISSDTIAREAVLDQLTREAQEQDMGCAKEAGQ